MKKLSIIVGILFFLLESSSVFAAFSDVKESNPFFDAINFVQEEAIVSGYPDGKFMPERILNRAEFIKIVVGSIFSEEEIKSCFQDKKFSDVTASDWVYGYTCIAKRNDIIKGYGDNSFKPWQPISFIEASKIIVKSFSFPVVEDEIWYKPYVETLGNKRAIPSTIGAFTQNLNRGELAEIIYRLKSDLTNKSSKTYLELENLRIEKDSRDWNIYHNRKYRYSLKYPENWYIGDKLVYPEVRETNNFGLYLNPGINSDLYLSIHVEVNMSLGENTACFDLFGCAKRYNFLRHPSTVSTISDQKNINFAGERALIQKISRGKWSDQEIIVFKSNNLYVLNFTTSFDKYDEKKLEFQRIIATFKFESPEANIINWITYKNENDGVSFKQPGFRNCCNINLSLANSPKLITAFADEEKVDVFNGFTVYLDVKDEGSNFSDYLRKQSVFLLDKKPVLTVLKKSADGIQVAWIKTVVDGQKIAFVSTDKSNRILIFTVRERAAGEMDSRINEVITSSKF